MPDPNLNAARGILDGVTTGLGLIDRRRRNDRQDQLWEQQDEDRERSLTREALQDERDNTLYQQKQEDRNYKRQRREVTDAQNDALMPIQLQAARSQATTAATKQRIIEQEAKNKEAMGLWREATTLFQGGEYEAADSAMSKLADYGYDVDSMTTTAAAETQDTAKKLLTNQIGFDSPEARKLAQQLLTPSLVQSGRDPKRFKIGGLLPTGQVGADGSEIYTVTMIDNETGTPVPGTLNKTSAADNDATDPVSEITANQLMTATQGYIADSTHSAQVRLKAVGARLGAEAFDNSLSRNESLKNEKLEAEIAKIKAETAETTGSSLQGIDDPMSRLFVREYEGNPRMQPIAELLQEDPNFTFESGARAMAEIKAMAAEEKYETFGAGSLYVAYQRKKEIERDIKALNADGLSSFLQDFPNMEERHKKHIAKRINAFTVQFKDSKINATQYQGRIDKLREQLDAEINREKNDAREKQIDANRITTERYLQGDRLDSSIVPSET